MTDSSPTHWDRARNHYLYDPGSNEIRVYRNVDAWTVTGPEAASYVRSHLIGAARNDHPSVLCLYEKTGRHPFMLLRSLLPYLTWAAELYRPRGTEPDQAVAFATRYMSQYVPVMRDVYTVYRHGLMHRHFPNCNVEVEGDAIRLIAWQITARRSAHLKVTEIAATAQDGGEPIPAKVIPLVPAILYEDLIVALEQYATDLENDPELMRNFLTAFRRL